MAQVLFKLLPLCWVFEWVNLCMGPLRASSWFLRAPRLTRSEAPEIFKARCYGSLSFQCRSPEQGLLGTLFSPGRTLSPMISFLLMDCHTEGVRPHQTMSLPSYTSQKMWLFLYIFICGRAVLLVFRLLSERTALYVVAP